MSANSAIIGDRLVGGASGVEASTSGAAWGAILAGAGAAAALSLVLLTLGFGLGMSSISPWSGHGLEAWTVGVSALAWLFATQIIASGLGGYLAGRLRVKWPGVHNDEVYFRDTAHGFLTWAIASLATAAFLGGAATAALNGGVQAGATLASAAGVATAQVASAGAAGNAEAGAAGGSNGGVDTLGYFVDNLFRGDSAAAAAAGTPAPTDNKAAAAEATTILAYDLRSGELSNEDRQRLGQLITQRTGLNSADAEKRASDVYSKLKTTLENAKATAKEAADKARKAAAHTSLWLFVALLCGAFAASYSATLGGRQRDNF